MRNVPEAMVARLESGAARLCHVWLVRKHDGRWLGFTDHDQDLGVAGIRCRAGSGWTAGAGEAGVGLVPGTVSAGGGLDDEALSEADIVAGLYDNAEVELWQVDWGEPELRVQLWAGALSRIRREGGAFVADLAGPLAKLERVVGRTYGRLCDAVLGDDRCGLGPQVVRQKICDKRWTTCVREFRNGANFRGFPDIPGDDFILVRAGGRALNDGKSRR